MKTLISTLALILSPFFLIAQNGLDTDGFDDVATAANASALIAGSNQIAMTMWVYPTNPAAGWPNFDGFGGFRNENDADFYLLQLNSNQVEARFRNSSGTNFTFTFDTLQLNAWNHFALIYNGTNLVGYHNGEFEKQISASGMITNTTEGFHIGWVPFQTNPFLTTGKFDEVSLWKRSLSASEIECIYYSGINQPDPDLMLYYKMDQGVAGGNNAGITQLTDSAGNIDANLTGFALTGGNSNFVTGVPQYIDIQAAACGGDSVLFDGQYYSVAGVYRNVYAAANGCDSIRQLTLATGNNSNTQVFDTICSGSSYTFPDGSTQSNITASTSQTSNLLTAIGCDSIIVTDLHVFVLPSTNVLDTVCNGDSYTFPDGSTQNNISTALSQTSTLSSAQGCDSVVITDLSVITLDTSVTFTPPATLTSNMANANYQWILCHVLNIPAQGAVFQSFTPSNPGSYAVQVSSGGCVDTSGCHAIVDVNALLTAERYDLEVFPNPSKGSIFLKMENFGSLPLIRVYDMKGREMPFSTGTYASDTDMLEIPDLPEGSYILVLNFDGQIITRRVQIR